MKIALFGLGILAFAQGIHLEGNSSMVVEYDFEEDEPGQACITPPCGVVPLRNFCHGFAEIRTEFNGVETKHGKMIKDEGEIAPKKASKMRYNVPGGRDATKIIEVQGNCCWKFYKKSRYRGNLKAVSNSGRLTPSFAPRSLKIVEC